MPIARGESPAPERVAADDARDGLRRYETPYYFIHTDLAPPDAAEAVARLARLAEFYRRRTRDLGFTGRIERRLPVYLFKDRADYLATGAPPESAGAFLGDRLVAAATDRAGRPAWNVVQHEAFHQFAAAVRGPDLPGWLNEGLGEYFGESLFTGDQYVTGVAPAWRARRVKGSIRDGKFMPLVDLLRMPQDQWNEAVVLANYDQAWSVVHFILDAPGGGSGEALASFVKDLSAGRPAAEAWEARFGAAGDFERRWRDHWLGLPDDSASGRYAEAATLTVTGFLARADAAGQSFDTVDALLAAAKEGTLRVRPDDRLPPGLLPEALRWVPEGGAWSIDRTDASAPRVLLTLRDGRHMVGTFVRRPGQAPEVRVRVSTK